MIAASITSAFLIAAVIAAEKSTDLPPWLNYGLLGLMVLAFILQQIVPGALWKAERSRADGYEVLFRDRVLPLLDTTTGVLSQVVELLKDFKNERDTRMQAQENSIRELLDQLLKDKNVAVISPAKRGGKKSAASRGGKR